METASPFIVLMDAINYLALMVAALSFTALIALAIVA